VPAVPPKLIPVVPARPVPVIVTVVPPVTTPADGVMLVTAGTAA